MEDDDAGGWEWQILAHDLEDESYDPFIPFNDKEASQDCETAYAYRVTAQNSQGLSMPSPAVIIECR